MTLYVAQRTYWDIHIF